MRKIVVLLAAILITLIFILPPNVGAVTWIDWQSTSSGSLTIGGTTIDVSLTGNPWDLINGDFYYNNSYTGGTSPSGTYGGLQPSDLIRVTGTGNFALTFDSPVVDPYIALVSVGSAWRSVTYSFDTPFTVISTGSNFWGYGGYSVSGNDFTGIEFNGILQFQGTYSSFSFDILQPEGWHGFNLGVADAASPIPEPSTILLLGSGLAGLAGFRQKFKVKTS